MTATTLLRALAGLLICTGILTTISLLIMALVWYMIRNDIDFEDLEYIEDEEL
jgi:4-hydroxybenzoate polyprenyltransferase